MSTADPPVYGFVLGTGRCGSTLAQEVLARHEDAGFVSNIDDNLARLELAGRLNSTMYRRLPTFLQEKGRLRYAPSEGYKMLDRQVSPLLSTPSRDLLAADATPWLSERFRRFFETRAHAQDAPLFLHKFTGWPRSGFIQAVFPEARFVNVVRDGRAVANSWLQMDWWKGYEGPDHWQFGPLCAEYAEEWEASGRSFVLLAGLAWKLLLDSFAAARQAAAPGTWLDIRYEDVVTDPHATFERALDFLGLGMTPAFEAQLARYEFRSGRSEAFRRDLDPTSLALLDASLADHLGTWGYAPS